MAEGTEWSPMRNAIDRLIRSAVRERDQHRCQFPALEQGVPSGRKCGRSSHWAGMDIHHRKQSSAGGESVEDNLIYLCHEHHMWCHDNIGIARDLGLIVCEGDDPDRQPWMDERIPEDMFHYENEEDAWGGEGEMPPFSEASEVPPW